jgi:hypothetical protein
MSWADLLDALAAVGWTWRDGFLHAPKGSIWFGVDPIESDLHEFRDRMRCRRDRLCRFREWCAAEHRDATNEALEDMEGLLAVLDRLP